MRTVPWGVALLLTSGCGHMAYKVTSDRSCGGVPFLPIESLDVVKSSYQQTWLEIRVDAVFENPAPELSAAPGPPAAAAKGGSVNVNTATEDELAKLADLKPFAKKIIAARPYRQLSDLVDRNVLSKALFKIVASKLTTGNLPAAPEKPQGDTFTRTVVAYTHDLEARAADEALVTDIYSAFLTETGSAEKEWSVSGLVLARYIADKRLSLAEPPILPGASLVERSLIAQERSRIQAPAASPLYYNIRVPSGGTVSGELDLAANGTMTKATSQVQDQLPGSIATAVGSVAGAALGSGALNTLTAHFFAPAQAPQPQGQGVPSVKKVDLAITRMRRVYTVTITRSVGTTDTACGVKGLLSPATASNPTSQGPSGSQEPPQSPPSPETCWLSTTVQTNRGGDDKPKSAKDSDDATTSPKTPGD
jgi:hypothetical protein